MMTASIETIPDMLADIHVTLHGIDPGPLIKSLNEQGFDENRYLFNTVFDAVAELPKELSWIRDAAEWMVENRPPEPGRLAICHGDFHPNNILIQNGQVTGVLDWHLTIADPAFDIAYTIQVLTVHSKAAIPDSEWASLEMVSRLYLDAYRAQIPLDSAKLDYYRVVNSLRTLIDGFIGNQHLSHPFIVKDLIEFVNKVTGIQIAMPD
jgi:aminoglycoside phosphotransferase (APT) family kinase protein